MTNWAFPGARIVCVDDSLYNPAKPHVEYVGSLDGLKSGEIYTIREIYVDPDEGNIQVRLNEILRPITDEENTGRESGYRLSRFRPLIQRKDDLELFNHLLNPSLVDKLDLLAERLDELYTSDAV